jgi:hypothetical protein
LKDQVVSQWKGPATQSDTPNGRGVGGGFGAGASEGAPASVFANGSDLTHAQRADIIHAAMIRAGLYASRDLPPAVGSSLLSSAVTGRCGGGLAPGAAVHQGLFLASDESDGEGSDLA